MQLWYQLEPLAVLHQQAQMSGAAWNQPVTQARGFSVGGHPLKPTTDGTRCVGETERARQSGIELARALESEEAEP